MAFFEEEGFCPSCSSFGDYPAEKKNGATRTIIDILNGRQSLMVYAPECKSWFDEYPSIVDAMFGGDGILGIQLATIIARAVPGFNLQNRTGIRKIRLIDCLNPTDLDPEVFYDPTRGDDENWQFFVDGRASFQNPIRETESRIIVYDSRYAIVMVDVANHDLVIRLLRIPPRK